MNSTDKHKIQGLYAITDPVLCPNETLISQVEAAIEGGAQVIQYRDKTQDMPTQIKMARRLAELCHRHNVCFIINDDIELARISGADGIHLGKDDSAIDIARKALGESAIIGISCYNSIERARKMQQSGADYVAFGRFFPSQTKPKAPQADLNTLTEGQSQLEIPIVAIGGVNGNNAAELIRAGADSVAVIQGVFANASTRAITLASQQIKAQFAL